MILVSHQLKIVDQVVLLCFGEIPLIVALSIILLIISVLKLMKIVVGIGCSQTSMFIQKLVEEYTRGILFAFLLDKITLPWCLMGDFNDILHADENKGRSTRPNWLIRGFRQAVQDDDLVDVHMEGYPFTWFKRSCTPRAVEEKLDTALASNSWMQMFPNTKL